MKTKKDYNELVKQQNEIIKQLKKINKKIKQQLPAVEDRFSIMILSETRNNIDKLIADI